MAITYNTDFLPTSTTLTDLFESIQVRLEMLKYTDFAVLTEDSMTFYIARWGREVLAWTNLKRLNDDMMPYFVDLVSSAFMLEKLSLGETESVVTVGDVSSFKEGDFSMNFATNTSGGKEQIDQTTWLKQLFEKSKEVLYQYRTLVW
jgi:hypothetical protein